MMKLKDLFRMRNTKCPAFLLLFTLASYYFYTQVFKNSKKLMPLYIDKAQAYFNPDATFQNNLTVVTAFFDIGSFSKGSLFNMRSTDDYLKWARTFQFLLNPLVVYTDSRRFLKHIQLIRANLFYRTEIFLIDKIPHGHSKEKKL